MRPIYAHQLELVSGGDNPGMGSYDGKGDCSAVSTVKTTVEICVNFLIAEICVGTK
jgi:hypothetical protein